MPTSKLFAELLTKENIHKKTMEISFLENIVRICKIYVYIYQ